MVVFVLSNITWLLHGSAYYLRTLQHILAQWNFCFRYSEITSFTLLRTRITSLWMCSRNNIPNTPTTIERSLFVSLYWFEFSLWEFYNFTIRTDCYSIIHCNSFRYEKGSYFIIGKFKYYMFTDHVIDFICLSWRKPLIPFTLRQDTLSSWKVTSPSPNQFWMRKLSSISLFTCIVIVELEIVIFSDVTWDSISWNL